jgi:hypothetical protein
VRQKIAIPGMQWGFFFVTITSFSPQSMLALLAA